MKRQTDNIMFMERKALLEWKISLIEIILSSIILG